MVRSIGPSTMQSGNMSFRSGIGRVSRKKMLRLGRVARGYSTSLNPMISEITQSTIIRILTTDKNPKHRKKGRG